MLRKRHLQAVERKLRSSPVVALLGPRQSGKTTLARELAAQAGRRVTFFDLERAEDVRRLADPMLALEPLRGLVVLDEIQRAPEVFPTLRVLADRKPRVASFLVLGSASPQLLRQSPESLAGRIAHHELGPFSFDELDAADLDRLWLRGGFPRSFLARSARESSDWRREFVRTFLERDLGQLGFAQPSSQMGRFWGMLAHYHGQIWNAAEFGRSFGMSDTSVRTYLDAFAATFMVRQLMPWHENAGKRLVKSPKVYLTDSGILHSLLGVEGREALERHPKVGASWEGLGLQSVMRILDLDAREVFFWATHQGAELDLLVVRNGRRWGFEFKRTSAPTVTKSMHIACQDLKLERLYVIHAGRESFPLTERITAVSLARAQVDLRWK